MEDFTQTIGLRIKKKRENLGMSQKELSDKVKVTPSAINQYENGTKRPSSEILKRIAVALGVSTDYLLGSAKEDDIFVDEEVAMVFRKFKGLSTEDREKILENIKFLKHLSRKKR